MYIMTKDKGIINLDCYPRIDVFTKNNNCYLLCAFSKLVLCQASVEGYSFLSLILASSVVNRQWTVARC